MAKLFGKIMNCPNCTRPLEAGEIRFKKISRRFFGAGP